MSVRYDEGKAVSHSRIEQTLRIGLLLVLATGTVSLQAQFNQGLCAASQAEAARLGDNCQLRAIYPPSWSLLSACAGVPFQDSHKTLPSSANGGAHDVGLPFEGPSMRVRPSMFSTLSFPSISRPARCTELETTRLQYSCDVLSFPLFCTCADCSSSCLLPGVRRFSLATPIHTVFGFTSPSSLH